MSDTKNNEDRVSALEERVNKLEKFIFYPSDNRDVAIGKKLSIKEFLLTKNIDNDVKRTLALAYFMEKFESIKSFNTDDLKKYYQLAKHPLPLNPNDKVNQGIKGGFLMETETKKDSKKSWTLTSTGEKIVEDNFVFSANK